MKNSGKKIFALAVVFSLLWGGFFAISGKVLAEPSLQDQQAELQRQLAEIEAQIAQYQQELKSVQGEKNTLQNKINQLKNQQSTLNLQIRSTNLQINDLAGKIRQTEVAIDQNKMKMDRIRDQIGRTLREIYERDDDSLLLAMIAKDSFSDMLFEIESHDQIFQGLESSLRQADQLDQEMNQYQDVLSGQKNDAKDLLNIQTLQKQQLSQFVSQQNSLLSETKGKESNYQSIISNTQKRANEIRQRLYQLLGISNDITFGQAVEIAQNVSARIGVRAAFLLAILTQESNLGKNVGQCYIKDESTGNGVNIKTGKAVAKVMSPTRDVQPFLNITAELGRDPFNTQVSCPMSYGWGGAMGPAQFIPSTWMGYKARIEAITGKTADPWDIRDAFLAAGIKLAKDGATSQSGEWRAAMIYFSGSTNTKYRFYGDNVVAQAEKYQADIDALSQ